MLIFKYGLLGSIELTYNLLKTKVFFNSARLIRFPFRVRGTKHIDFGNGLTTGVGCRIDAFPENKSKVIFFGHNVQINDYVHIGAIERIEIGDNVLIASKVFITDHNHGLYSGNEEHSDPETAPDKRVLYSAPVIIKDNVWIGEFVSVLPGVTIGEGAIIGCNSVVNKDVPPFSIAVGIPARVIKKYCFNSKKWVKYE